MAYSEITQYDSPNFTPHEQTLAVFGMARSIDGVTIHWWNDPAKNPTFEGIIDGFCQEGGTSAHAVATGTGRRVAWLVNAVDTAWHSGSAKGNATTIGVECDPRTRDEDYDVIAELVADIWIAYNRKLPLYPHNKWTPTRCPGVYSLGRLQAEAENWYNRKTNNIIQDIKQEGDLEMAKPTVDEVRQAYQNIAGREPSKTDIELHSKNGSYKALIQGFFNNKDTAVAERDRLKKILGEETEARRAAEVSAELAAEEVKRLTNELHMKQPDAGNYNKFWVALGGAIVTILIGLFGESSQIVQTIIVLLTAAGVYSVPNKNKE